MTRQIIDALVTIHDTIIVPMIAGALQSMSEVGQAFALKSMEAVSEWRQLPTMASILEAFETNLKAH